MIRLLLPAALAALTALTGCYDEICTTSRAPEAEADQALYRNPETGTCQVIGGGGGGGGGGDACGDYGGGEDEPQPVEDAPGAFPAWAVCSGVCEAYDEATCLDVPGCRAAYATDWPTDGPIEFIGCWGTSPAVRGGGSCDGLDAFTCSMHDDCIAVHTGEPPAGEADEFQQAPAYGPFAYCADEPGDVDPPDPGSCTNDSDVMCDALPPECPQGTVPGILDGCWSGYCIPIEDCEDLPACSSLASESSCVGRGDCAPIYEGIDCTCDENGCSCADWSYATCEDEA